MNTLQLVNILKNQLKTLEQEVLQHDNQLAPPQRKLLQDVERFNQSLFIQHGAQLMPCIEQIRSSISQLEKQIALKLAPQTIALSCERIQDRFTAVKRALATTTIDLKAKNQQRASQRARFAKQQVQSHQASGFGWIASNVMQNSHEIYEELNKHLNWAKKFEQKIAEMESNLENCHSADKIRLQNDILLMHRRLGKCRQAISYIEDRIQAFERPHQSINR
ncbi:primosomal replication protein [Shewanella acanthi]|uniref:primosomal replication protein n=1 Tax=Shewanella acanthi TaxID=2864212 RepID=UPI001C660859|nr:primosomal replication protein [Shewanella acanthi]MCH1928998.1 primosomal replication protein [Shewanella shenzhenensis]QYJ77694.1 primosomal replication protein [Shewanella acanthi]